MKKALAAILTATIILLSSLVPLLYVVQPARAASDPTNWYMTIPGVLNTDTYTLYPYANKSLSIGISQFGEMIDPYTGIGLSYGQENIDPFVNEQFIPQFEWNQGWLINLTYSYTGEYRNVWAFALYSDSYNQSSIGGNWVQAPSSDSITVVGGRKYGGMRWNNGAPVQIGYATTAPLTVLYNSPREFIALSKNTIGEDVNTPLVGVYLTFVFDKVKKYVTVYKDVKLLDDRKFTGNIQVEFSNRGEWDLGLATAPPSYADFFDGLSTSYEVGYQPFYNNGSGGAPDATFDLAQILSTAPEGYVGFAAYWPTPISESMVTTALTTRTTLLSTLSTFTADFIGDGSTRGFTLGTGSNPPAVAYPRGQGVWASDPMVFVDGTIVPEDPVAVNGWTWSGQTVLFNNPPSNNATIWIIYKHQVHNDDLIGEPAVPYIIAEWDFDLNHKNDTGSTNMFRAVTVYGVTDRHDGSDELFTTSTPWGTTSGEIIDREVQYQLNETFNPWDLGMAVSKRTDRYVEYSLIPIGTSNFTTANSPVVVVPTLQWDQYNVFSERVEDLNTSTVLNRYLDDYNFTLNLDGTATFGGLDPTHYYKFLYSTTRDQLGISEGRYEWGIVGRDASTVDSAGLSMINVAFEDMTELEVGYGLAGADANSATVANQMPWVMSQHSQGTSWANYYYSGTDFRTALKDDWCTHWPIASSNMIGVGGPLANMLAYYGNDFATAFYGLNQFTTYPTWQNAIVALSCWNGTTKGYTDTNTTGYAVVSTYQDINGTVLFLAWGNWGRDTYYISYWLWNGGGLDALSTTPVHIGVTSIIVKIDYKSYPEGYKPTTYTVIEALGTISETHYTGTSGIHPDP